MKKILFLILIATKIYSQVGTWAFSMRTHPELEWHTIQTKNFNIHYHNGIEEIAKQGAAIAEHVMPTLLKQLKIDSINRVDITFTAEDEIFNGYASWTNSVFIWVDQNDSPVWLENEKWLYQVVSHELQHIVFFNAIKTWFPEPFNLLIGGTPNWFIEGLAEYFTEKWRPGRSDLSHKNHLLRNSMDKMDPHNDGYSKLLYLSTRFSDSTIVKILKWRDKDLKLFDFEKSFLENTGINLKQFEEDWRRQMNTYYFGVRAQKETYEEVGNLISLPVKSTFTFKISNDSLKIAMLGKLNNDQLDESLILAIEDTSKPKKNLFSFLNKKETDSVKTKKDKKYKIDEIDFGNLHSMNWSNDGKLLAYSKYHYANKQEMVWDLILYDTEKKKSEWITTSLRATFPTFSKDGNAICFVSHKNNVSNLFLYNLQTKEISQLTNFEFDTQILSPQYSDDGNKISFAVSKEDGNLNIAMIEISTKNISILTKNPEAEYSPIWINNDSAIVFTSHKNGTPNLYKISLINFQENQITDIGDALFSLQVVPKSNKIFASTLGDVDTARFVLIDPNRIITTSPLSIRENFKSWRTKSPDFTINSPAKDFDAKIISDEKYSTLKNIKHITSIAFPYFDGTGAFALTNWGDAMGRELITVGALIEKNKMENSGFLFSYFNATQAPFISFEYYKNIRTSYRNYDESKSGLNEWLNGIYTSASLPINFGNSMSDYHDFGFSLQLRDRIIDPITEDENGKIVRTQNKFLPFPENAKEGAIGLHYYYLSDRPSMDFYFKQRNRNGVIFDIEKISSKIYGNFDYTKFSADIFSTIKLGPFGFYTRLKSTGIDGKAPGQEYIGITTDPPIYLPMGNGVGGILQFPENHSLRGIDTVKLGNRLVLGTVELRLPIAKNLPINIFGLSIGSISLAVISDFGNSWYVGQKDKSKYLSSIGYESKFALQIGEQPFLFFSFGRAQSIESWKNNLNNLKTYFRMALISPL